MNSFGFLGSNFVTLPWQKLVLGLKFNILDLFLVRSKWVLGQNFVIWLFICGQLFSTDALWLYFSIFVQKVRGSIPSKHNSYTQVCHRCGPHRILFWKIRVRPRRSYHSYLYGVLLKRINYHFTSKNASYWQLTYRFIFQGPIFHIPL